MKQLFSLMLVILMLILPVHAEDIEMESDYIYMIDPQNDQVLIDQGSNELIYPASMTKMMTLIVALENIEDKNEIITLDHEVFKGLYEANASLAGFSYNEQVSVQDCLYGLFLPSGAECTRALAILTAGSEEEFVKLMNHKAKELNMDHTHFVNTTGLHHKDHVTTLQDLSILMKYCLNNPDFYEIFSTRSYTATSGSVHKELKMNSTLFKRLSNEHSKWIVGGKTGYTNPAGLCLASLASHDGRDLLLITAHAPVSSTPYHLLDAVTAYTYVFDTMHKLDLCQQDVAVSESFVKYTLPKTTVQLYPEETLSLTLDKNISVNDLTLEVVLNEEICAPLTAFQNLGTLNIYYQDQLLNTCAVEVREDVIQSDLLIFIDYAQQWIESHIMHLGVSFVGLILLLMLRKKK